MKKEEAIIILDSLHLIGCGRHQHENDLKINVALDMAIEALQADRPSGEWIRKGDYAMCSKCGGLSDTQFDGVERIPKTTAFCPNCGARMLGKYRLKKEVK